MRAHFKELGRESLIYGTAGMLNKFIAVFLVPLYTHVFSTEEFGVQGLVVTMVTLAAIVAVLGLDTAAANWYWQTEDEGERRTTLATWFWCHIAAASVLGLLLWGLAGRLSELISGDERMIPLLQLAAATLPLNVCQTVVLGYFRLRRQAAATMWFTIAANLLLIALTAWFVLGLRLGLRGIFLAQITAGVCTTLAGLWILRWTVSPRLARLARLREMMPYALPLIPAALGFWALGLADRLFVEKMQSTSDVGIYQLGTAVASAVAMGTGAFAMAWGSFALSLQREPGAPAIYARALLIYLALGGAAAAGVAFFAREIVALLAPEEYSRAAAVAAVLCLSVVANGLSYVAATGLSLARKSAPVSAAVMVAAALNMALNVLLIPPFGIMGAAWAAAVSWAVYSTWIFVSAQKVHRLPYNWRRGLVMTGLLIAVVIAAPHFHAGSLAMNLLVKGTAAAGFALVLLSIAVPEWPGMLRRARRVA